MAYQRLSKIELSAKKVNDFQCKAITTNGSSLDFAGLPDPTVIKIFGKVISNLTLIWVGFLGVHFEVRDGVKQPPPPLSKTCQNHARNFEFGT